jgi:uncharacterized protein (TIGR04222 family)
MNPFELPGPQFLAFYAVLGIVVVWAVFVVKRQAEGGEPVHLPSMDPYLIAYLRGGAADAVSLGVAVLVDRQLLAIGKDDTVFRREHVNPVHGSNDLERAILEQCATAEEPRDLTKSKRLQDVARRSYEPQLVHMRLLAEADTRWRRLLQAGLAIVFLMSVAGVKVAIGVARNRPVSFLVLFAFGFSAVTLAVVVRGRQTVLGEQVLADLATLFEGLRDRANELRPYSSTSELALLMAVFGLGAVPLSAFPFRRAFPSATDTSTSSTSSCGSSCGSSSCGGGGSSCGGGGGCGGCGSS